MEEKTQTEFVFSDQQALLFAIAEEKHPTEEQMISTLSHVNYIDTSSKENLLLELETNIGKLIDEDGRMMSTFTDVFGDFLLQYWHGRHYIPVWGGYAPCIVLFSINVPEVMRKQGIGSKIMEMLENLAYQTKRVLMVRPVVNEDFGKLLEKRGYAQRTFFEFYRIHPKFKATKVIPQEN